MRMEHGGGVFGMKLSAYVPLVGGNLHYLHKVGGGIDAHTLHACRLEICLILIVELIAMAMTLADLRLLTIGLPSTTALTENTLIGSEAHGATHLLDRLLLFH